MLNFVAMAKKITVQDNSIQIQDTVSTDIEYVLKASTCWYDENTLEIDSKVKIYYSTGDQQKQTIEYNIADTVDSTDSVFTKSSFRSFAVEHMGVSPESQQVPYSSAVALGHVEGSTIWTKFGYNSDIDTGTEVIASFGGTFFPPLTADNVDIVSTSVNDIAAGSGANSLVVYGIDENREELIEVVTLNGTSAVTTTGTFFGINRIAPFLCGDSYHNEGVITATMNTSGQVIAEMPINNSVTQQCILYIRANHTFLLESVITTALRTGGGGGEPKVTVIGYVYSPVANAKIEVFRTKLDVDVTNQTILNFSDPFPITESSILWFEATTDKNNLSIDLRFSGEEILNT